MSSAAPLLPTELSRADAESLVSAALSKLECIEMIFGDSWSIREFSEVREILEELHEREVAKYRGAQ